MPRVFTFRMLSGDDDGFVRDFEVRDDQTLLELHQAIQENLGFDPGIMSSFFSTGDTWEKEEEFPLMNMTGEEGTRTMENTKVGDLVSGKEDKLLYLYDYLSNRGFFLEVVAVAAPSPQTTYPRCTRAEGDPPQQLMIEDLTGTDAGEDLFPEDDDDLLSDDFENIDDLPEI